MFRRLSLLIRLLLAVLACLSTAGLASAQATPQKLALFIAAPHGNEPEMQNDIDALQQALSMRGFTAREMQTLRGQVDRARLIDFLKRASLQVQDWKEGTIFLAYSGHGDVDGKDPMTAKPALSLANGDKVRWEEVFQTLRVPDGVRIILLPDC